jgi:hypothetical protein
MSVSRTIVAGALVLTACSSGEQVPPQRTDAVERAGTSAATAGDVLDLDAIDTQSATLPSDTGRTVSGDEIATWRATLVDGRLLRLVEQVNRGDYSSGERRHYFVAGLHRATTERRMAVMLERDAAATTDTIMTQMEWSPDGTLVRGNKMINGSSRPLAAYEAAEARAHVALVAQQALIRARPRSR